MQRVRHPPRGDWRARMQALGFGFAEIGGEPYWDEGAHYRLTAAGVDTLEDATNEVQRLCLLAVDHAVRGARHATLGIPEGAWPLAVRSWERQEGSLYGRMDLRWDGDGPPLLLEYNADTPTALYEAAVVQWDWVTSAFPGADQFNSIHEALTAAWPPAGSARHRPLHRGPRQRGGPRHRRVPARHRRAGGAGGSVPVLGRDRLGRARLRGPGGPAHRGGVQAVSVGVDAARPLRRQRRHAPAPGWVEPAWRMILSGKGILALLWELFPGHPNLLPAFREPGRTGGPELRKPLWGREGANIAAPGFETGGPYGADGWVHQAWRPLPRFDGRYPVIGSWVVAGRACGIGIREDATPITRDTSRFVPHLFLPGDP